MAFLFKSKKAQGAQAPGAKGEPPANSASTSLSSLQNTNGKAPLNEKTSVPPPSSTPQSSVNNSVNSLAGANNNNNNTPSPEQTVRRVNTGDVPTTGSTSDLPVSFFLYSTAPSHMGDLD